MEQFAYPAQLTPDEKGSFMVRFRDIPEAITSGKDRADAIEQAADCLQEALAGRLVRRDPIPTPSKVRRGDLLIPVAMYLAPKLALFTAMQSAGINNSEMARRLNVTEIVVRRMLDPKHENKSGRIESALRALGRQAVVHIIGDAA
jgi:antitoxin HicB